MRLEMWAGAWSRMNSSRASPGDFGLLANVVVELVAGTVDDYHDVPAEVMSRAAPSITEFVSDDVKRVLLGKLPWAAGTCSGHFPGALPLERKELRPGRAILQSINLSKLH